MTITLHPGSVTLAQLQAIYWNGESARLDRPVRPPRTFAVDPAELAAHDAFVDRIRDPIWRR